MITFPGAYHGGFNHGFNLAESTNFAIDHWIREGRGAGYCRCSPHSVRIDVDRFETIVRQHRYIWYMPVISPCVAWARQGLNLEGVWVGVTVVFGRRYPRTRLHGDAPRWSWCRPSWFRFFQRLGQGRVDRCSSRAQVAALVAYLAPPLRVG